MAGNLFPGENSQSAEYTEILCFGGDSTFELWKDKRLQGEEA